MKNTYSVSLSTGKHVVYMPTLSKPDLLSSVSAVRFKGDMYGI